MGLLFVSTHTHSVPAHSTHRRTHCTHSRRTEPYTIECPLHLIYISLAYSPDNGLHASVFSSASLPPLFRWIWYNMCFSRFHWIYCDLLLKLVGSNAIDRWLGCVCVRAHRDYTVVERGRWFGGASFACSCRHTFPCLRYLDLLVINW